MYKRQHYAYAFATDGKTVSNSIGGKYGDDSNVCYYRNAVSYTHLHLVVDVEVYTLESPDKAKTWHREADVQV